MHNLAKNRVFRAAERPVNTGVSKMIGRRVVLLGKHLDIKVFFLL